MPSTSTRVPLFAALGLALALPGALGCASAEPGRRADVAPTAPGPEVPAPRNPATVQVGPLDFDTDPDGFAYLDGRTGEVLTFADVTARLARADVVLVGERHDRADHHSLQRRVVDALGANGPGLAVALEMVPWSLQQPLDRYAQGEIDEDGLYAALDWERTWGHDFELYRDIFAAGRARGVRFVGVNAPRYLVKAVAGKGIDGLDDEERAALPQMDLHDTEHRAAIEDVFNHHHPPTGEGAFDRFYAAQVLWDESMAQGSADAVTAGARQVVVLAGNGHVAGYRGIARRLMRRLPDKQVVTVVPLVLEEGVDPQRAAAEAVAGAVGDILAVKPPREVVEI